MSALGSARLDFSSPTATRLLQSPIQPWMIETHGGVLRVASGPIATPTVSCSLWHGTKVERALPNGTSRDGDAVDLTRRCSDRR
jgi:hypothetical protein